MPFIHLTGRHRSCPLAKGVKATSGTICKLEPGALTTQCWPSSSQPLIARLGPAMLPANPLSCSNSWKSSFSPPSSSLSFCLCRLSGPPALSCWQPRQVRRSAADLRVSASLPTSCCSAACADPARFGSDFVPFNAANPQILCGTNTRQLKNDSFFGERALQTSIVIAIV